MMTRGCERWIVCAFSVYVRESGGKGCACGCVLAAWRFFLLVSLRFFREGEGEEAQRRRSTMNLITTDSRPNETYVCYLCLLSHLPANSQ